MKDPRTTIIPGLRYQDAPAAIEWLCRAFGFEKHLVVPGEGDTIAHAQLTFGNGMIMLGSAGEHGGGFDELMATPAESGGTNTQASLRHRERRRRPLQAGSSGRGDDRVTPDRSGLRRPRLHLS